MSEAGRLFGGRYEVQGPLASGGMAEVFVARDQLLGRPVALKILHPEFARDRAFIERFRREAQSAASLNDPRVVSIYDWGSDGGTYYLVMEYVDGKSLKELIQSEGPFTPERAEEIGADVCSALHFAHRHGIVHRDVKPANIMINSEGKTKVMDFGIARAITDSGATVTQTGTVLGTANYLSPEQAQGMPVDARSDVYSVGVVLYEMLTGEVPFKADTAVAIAYKHVRESPKPPSQLNPEIPPALDAVVLKALSKNADNRYQSADEMRLDLQRLLAGQAVEATPVLPVDQTVAMATTVGGPPRDATTVMPAVGRQREVPPSRRGLAYGLVLLLIAAVLVGAGALVYGVVSGGTARVVVPNVVGLPLASAQSTLAANKLKGVQDSTAFSDTVPVGSVVSQSVTDGTKVQPNSNILLTVSTGAQKGGVPDVTNQAIDGAKAILKGAGFTPGDLAQEFSPTVPQGQVTRTDPPAGTSVPKSTPIKLYVSGGKQTTALTDVTGFDQAHANQVLHDEGFNPVPATGCDRTKLPGVVLQQNPTGNQLAPQGSDVTITINQAKAVPNVFGMTQADATSTLKQAGFTPQVQTKTSLLAVAGTVVDQSPPSTANACPGDVVTITVSQGIGQSSPVSPSVSPAA